jgi:putative transposase
MRFIDGYRAGVGVEPICRALGVAPSSYYAYRSRTPSARALRDALLVEQIADARRGRRRVYGQRKTWKQLRRDGVTDVGRERVARVMREQGLVGTTRGGKWRTTIADPAADPAVDLVNRAFTATGPDALWVCDLTYVRTYHGFCYLAFILDVYSRMIVGWQIATNMRATLVTDALDMAHALRRSAAAGSLICHSDRGSQYTSLTYTDRLDEYGIAPSVGSKGDAYDNAMAEAWVATYKTECVEQRVYPSFEHAEHDALDWIGFYNHERLHEHLNDVPPAEYEAPAAAAGVSPDAPRRQATETSSDAITINKNSPSQTKHDDAVTWPPNGLNDRNEGTT